MLKSRTGRRGEDGTRKKRQVPAKEIEKGRGKEGAKAQGPKYAGKRG